MNPKYRSFEFDRDLDAVTRIWRETRWVTGDDGASGLEVLLTNGDAEVGVVNGDAECLIHRTAGGIFHGSTQLPLCAITAVTTSHVGRKVGMASTLTARALRSGAESGAAVAALGMFERGFYNRFGFGTGSPEPVVAFDPASLRLDHVPYRPPERLTAADSVEMMACRNRRLAHHGQITLDAPRLLEAEMALEGNCFALGYREGDRLTHFVIGSLSEENGPFEVLMLTYETGAGLLELLRLLREMGDQLHSVRMGEPPQVQLYALLDQPVRQRSRSLRSPHETVSRNVTWWQLRVLDVEQVVAAHHWPGDPVEFDLELSDPLGDQLDHDGGWHGVAGTYAVHVGRDSHAGAAPRAAGGDRPVLRCPVGAFSRLWFGVLPASALRLTGEIEAPPDLCAALDVALRLPPPRPTMSF